MRGIAVTKIFEFEACHHLPNYDGACARLHGHTYKLEVTVTNFEHGVVGCVDETGMIIDFKKLSEIVKTLIINKVDHQNLNDFYINPTAEVMVADFFSRLSKYLPTHIKVVEIKLWETSSSYASIRQEV